MSWRTRKAGGVIQSKSEELRSRSSYVWRQEKMDDIPAQGKTEGIRPSFFHFFFFFSIQALNRLMLPPTLVRADLLYSVY